MALFGALFLVFVVFVRPQEFVPGLGSIGILNIATGLPVLGIAIEFGMGKTKSAWSPQLPLVLSFVAWCAFTALIRVGASATLDLLKTGIILSTLYMFVVMMGARSLSRFRTMTLFILTLGVALALQAINTSRAEFECIRLDHDETGHLTEAVPEGRACEDIHTCASDEAGGNSALDYDCEQVGLFDTHSVGHGRVRWRGILADPNELALFVGAAMAFVFALHATMRSFARHLILIAVLAISLYCAVLTGSRGGVLVMLAVLAVYFVKRYGLKGLVLGALGGAPILAFGGRSGDEAESSSLERIGALYNGIDFFKQSPLFGIGSGQFTDNYFITAHNSYLLTAAELGFPGMLIWTTLLYLSIKIPVIVAMSPLPGLDPRVKIYALALASAYAGITIGILFLSFCYHPMMFIYFGLSGALYGLVKQTLPSFDVKVSGKEVGAIAIVDAGLLAFLFVYTRVKGIS